jgi:hypothetical protein
MLFVLPLLNRNAWGLKVAELKEFQPATSPESLIAVATDTLLPGAPIFVTFPPLNNVAIAAVGEEESPAPCASLLSAKPLETLFPDNVQRSLRLYCCAPLRAVETNRQRSVMPVSHPELLIVTMSKSSI